MSDYSEDSMVFFSQKVLRKIPGNFTFVIVTDRQDLDNQIYKNFAGAGGGIKEGETPVMEKSKLVEQLRQVIEETSSFCSGLGIDLTKIQTAYGFERVRLSDDAVDELLDDSISTEGYVIRQPLEPSEMEHLVDLSRIDFEALKARFQKKYKD